MCGEWEHAQFNIKVFICNYSYHRKRKGGWRRNKEKRK